MIVPPMICGTAVERIISNPVSPIVQAMSFSPSGAIAVWKRSRRSPVEGEGRSRAVTIPAAAPSANRDEATIVSGSSEERRCSVHSSTLTTRTTAFSSAAQN